MKRRTIFSAIFIIYSVVLYSQNEDYSINQIVEPPTFAAPDAFDMTEKAKTTIAYKNGSLNFSIPVYTVKSKYLSVPISLDYNSNGIKVNSVSSSVGIGWRSTAGGAVTRVVKRRPDEENLRHNYDTVTWSNPYSVITVGHSLGDLPNDGQNDLFSYCYPGGSGDFAFDREWNPFLIPKKNIKIRLIENSSRITGFIITDNDGVEYHFTVVGKTNTPPLGTLTMYDQNVTTSWHLKKIIHPMNDSIVFYYSDNPYNYVSGRLFRQTSSLYGASGGANCNCSAFFNVDNKEQTTQLTQNPMLDSIVSSHSKVVFVYSSTGDVLPKKKLDFIDIFDKFQNSSFTRYSLYHSIYGDKIFLDSLQQSNITSSIPPYRFEYISKEDIPERLSNAQDLLGYYNGKSNNSTLMHKEKSQFSYAFGYKSGADRSYSFEHAQIGLLNKVQYPLGGFSSIDYEPHTGPNNYWYYPVTNRSKILGPFSILSSDGGTSFYSYDTVFTTSKQGPVSVQLFKNVNHTQMNNRVSCYIDSTLILEIEGGQALHQEDSILMALDSGIHFLTLSAIGHASDLICEGIVNIYCQYRDSKPIYPEYGVRLKRIINDYGTENPNIQRIYYSGYSDTSIAAGSLKKVYFSKNFVETYYYTKCDLNPHNPIINFSNLCTRINWVANDLGSIGPYGGDFSYSKVSVSNGEYFENGGIEYILESELNSIGQILTPNNILDDGARNHRAWINGTVLQENMINSNMELISTKRYCYNDFDIDTLYNYDMRRVAGGYVGFTSDIREIQDFAGVKSSYESYWHRLDTVITTEYFPESNTSITTKELLFYDDTIGMQVTRKIRKSDDGVEYITQTKYPTMYAAGANDSPGQAIDSLNSKHIHNKILESVQMIKYPNEQNPGVFFSQMNMYRLENGLVVPDTAFALEISNTLAENSYDYSSTEGGTFQFDDHLKAKHVFDLFDEHGNLQQFHAENNFYTCYIWGYNYQFPIAKIENASYTSVESTLQSLGYSITSLQTKTASELKQIFNNLRNHPNMEQAMVSSYTYDPLFGLSSQTGPDGLEQKYEYDDFGRLETIREGHDYILKHFDYNYYVPE